MRDVKPIELQCQFLHTLLSYSHWASSAALSLGPQSSLLYGVRDTAICSYTY